MVHEKKTTGKEEIQVSEEERLHSIEETSVTEKPVPDAESNKLSKKDFPIVGIGASAGGLAAFEAFFSAMPADTKTGMAFVLVQHLDPSHKSILTELIGRYTWMPVYEVADRMAVKPDCVYVIPPNSDMVLQNGTLQLLEPAEPRGRRLPIDSFFHSMAQDKQERSVGIILSGMGSDGTLGIRAIKAEGGMVMAQDPESSEHDSMPLSAIGTGLVDYILKPAEMPAQLIAYVTKAFIKRSHAVFRAEDSMKEIFNILRVQIGHDFSHYKKNTINRRIERRMAVHNIENVDRYMRYLQQTPAEVEALFRDLLIGVTSFLVILRLLKCSRKRSSRVCLQANTQIQRYVSGCLAAPQVRRLILLASLSKNRWRR